MQDGMAQHKPLHMSSSFLTVPRDQHWTLLDFSPLQFPVLVADALTAGADAVFGPLQLGLSSQVPEEGPALSSCKFSVS